MAAGVSGYARTPRGTAAAGAGGRGRAAARARRRWSTAVAPGRAHPAGSDHFAVFTPYFRHWSRAAAAGRRSPRPGPCGCRTAVGSEELPDRTGLAGLSPGLAAGGEGEGRRRCRRPGCATGLGAYEDRPRRPGRRRDLPAVAASALRDAVRRWSWCTARGQAGGPGADAFVRQLCWRDFHRQVLAARPGRRPPTTAPGTTAGVRSARPAPTSRRGGRAAPATRWSTRRCGSCATRAGCTTAAGC